MTKTQKSKLEKLLHEACILTYGEKCLKCGRTTNIQCSHIYPKGTYQRMRYLVINTKPLCWRCHFNFWHKHPIAAAEWLKTVIPAPRLKKLRELSNKVLPPLNYEQIKKELEREIMKHKNQGMWRIINFVRSLIN